MGLAFLIVFAVPFPHFVDPVPMPRFFPIPMAPVEVAAEVKHEPTRPAPVNPERKPQDAGSVTTEGSAGSGAGCPNGQCRPRFRLFRR